MANIQPPPHGTPQGLEFEGWLQPEKNGRFVFKARHLGVPSGSDVEFVAVKGIRQSATPSKKYVLSEVCCLRNIWHRHIPQFLRVERVPDKQGDYLAMITQYIPGGSLQELLELEGPLIEEKALWIFQQIILIIDYLHVQMNIMHRDIKLSNFLVENPRDDKPIVYMCDFGFAKVRGFGVTNTKIGTPHYAAPEIITGNFQRYDGKVADIWSCGVCLFRLLDGGFPQLDAGGDIIRRKDLSPECVRFLGRILDKDPENRIKLDNIWKDEWFLKDLPTTRQFNEDMMKHPGRLEEMSRGRRQSHDAVLRIVNEMWDDGNKPQQ